ncbi:MAG: alpha-1,4-glucan--maltose-1-phosphate maltosyltransferase [Pirellulaceae bacterium]|nr:alpha-1,4-glucan--maltose-1-phosphate maltosyltransferase [Pirellulaceae bacterium]
MNPDTDEEPGLPPDGRSRVVIEGVAPAIDGGRYPVKRVVGDALRVEADIFCDGHDALTAVVQYRFHTDEAWREVPLEPLVNDRWRAEFTVDQIGNYEYRVLAWVDHFVSWHRDLRKRVAAGQAARVDLQIGAQLVERAASNAGGQDQHRLLNWVRRLRSDEVLGHLDQVCEDPELGQLMGRHASRDFATSSGATSSGPALRVHVDRERARCSAWYEMFPRSCSDTPGAHGTLRDVIARLPYVAEMGFDVLYLPPIHPIGITFRKGKNNQTIAQPDDVGSPWAIGGAEGGHKELHPQLGTWEDFDRLVSAAGELGIELALDIAFQCSPDHPYVAAQPGWFRQRPDGTVQYAENPPKKYQDIYPFDFETPQWSSLWRELKSVFDFWIARGVKIFRVDNPHTKPFGFWEWCLGEIHREHPDVLFLSEAFTRPKIMYRLAKLGFTQSYTYFAWRNTKTELTEYATELTTSEAREFFRPNFWPNTPDILTEHLQLGGRAAFMARVALAATLSANYGVYGPPYEHQWCVPREPGSEEYLHSEKYELHHHDLGRPDSLKEFLSRLNRIRREFAVLRTNETLRFHPVDNEQLICYSKATADGNQIILVIANLDPHHRQAGWVELPLEELHLEADHPFQVHDVLSDARYLWHGSRNYVELDPAIVPVHILHVKRRVRSERDFEYYL